MSVNTIKTDTKQDTGGQRVFVYFAMFFGLIIVTNSIFVYFALNTHSGVVTEKPYEKGLAFNDVLAMAEAQPNATQSVVYEDGVLRSILRDETGVAVAGASVTVSMVRPVKDGYDHNISLIDQGHGVYEATLNLPLKGLWLAKVNSQWNNKRYQMSAEIMNK